MTNLWKKETKKHYFGPKFNTIILKKTYFYSAKMAPPPKGGQKLITFEVAKLIILERPNGGQTNSSPASAHIYICIYIYAVVLLSGPSLAFWGVIIWAMFAFYKTLVVKKHYKNRGFSTFFLKKKNCARKFEVLLSGLSWSFFKMQSTWPR